MCKDQSENSKAIQLNVRQDFVHGVQLFFLVMVPCFLHVKLLPDSPPASLGNLIRRSLICTCASNKLTTREKSVD
jgi:hypothetical protein